MPSTYRARYSVERILVDRTDLDNDEELDWDLVLFSGPEGTSFLVGTLYCANSRGVGQVLSLARLTPSRSEADQSEAALVASHRPHVRPLYDTARRALAAQAALMDLNFELEPVPPRVEIRVLADDEDTETEAETASANPAGPTRS